MKVYLTRAKDGGKASFRINSLDYPKFKSKYGHLIKAEHSLLDWIDMEEHENLV